MLRLRGRASARRCARDRLGAATVGRCAGGLRSGAGLSSGRCRSLCCGLRRRSRARIGSLDLGSGAGLRRLSACSTLITAFCAGVRVLTFPGVAARRSRPLGASRGIGIQRVQLRTPPFRGRDRALCAPAAPVRNAVVETLAVVIVVLVDDDVVTATTYVVIRAVVAVGRIEAAAVRWPIRIRRVIWHRGTPAVTVIIVVIVVEDLADQQAGAEGQQAGGDTAGAGRLPGARRGC